MARNLAQAFDEFRSGLELIQTLQKAVTTHHNAVRKWIESYNISYYTKLVGSLQRRTRIQPRSTDSFDIDILVVLGSFNRWVSNGITPSIALEKVEYAVSQNEKYKKMGPETDSPTIILEYADNIKVELIPAYVDQIGRAPDGTPCAPIDRGYWIPKNNKWIMADYDYDAEHISNKNKETQGYLIPVIKILKSAKRNLFPEMNSYHLEVLSTNIIPVLIRYLRGEGIPISYHLLVSLFFKLAKDRIFNTHQLPSSKSPSASTNMNGTSKTALVDKFGKISDYCESIIDLTDKDAIEKWHELFGEPFSGYG